MAPGGIAEMCITAKVLQLGRAARHRVSRDASRRAAAGHGAVVRAREHAVRRNTKERRRNDLGTRRSTCKYAARASASSARSHGARRRSPRPRNVVDLRLRRAATSRGFSRNAGRGARIIGRRQSARAMLARARERMPSGNIAWQSRRSRRVGAPTRRRASTSCTAMPRCTGSTTTRRCSRGSWGIVARGGALAVQMPSNFVAPSHVALHADGATARAGARNWGAAAARSGGARRAVFRVALAARRASRRLDDRIPARACHPATTATIRSSRWMKGTALTPFLARARCRPSSEHSSADCASASRAAYPPRHGRIACCIRSGGCS